MTTLRVPGPPPRWPGGSILGMRREPLGFLQDLAATYGDVARFTLGQQAMFLVNHPDHIRDVLVTHQRNFTKGRGLERAKRMLGEGLLTSEGEFHLRQRRLAQPAFHRKRIASYGATMVHYAAQTDAGWQLTPGAAVNMLEEMAHLTLSIVGKTLFDADVTGESQQVGAALNTAISLFNIATLPFADLLDRLPLPSTRRFLAARAQLDTTIYRIINERRAQGEDRGDLLSMLLLSQDEQGTGTMSDEQLRDEAMTIFLAGHETTANALTWTWYLLDQHPAVAARLHAELDAVLAGRAPTMADLPLLPYTEMVVAESMRLYPPAWIIGRRAIADFELGGYTIPARSIVVMSPYVTQRDARFFPDPTRFDPERWTAAARESRPKFSYFPFGGGSRQCIGEQFAWMEGSLVLATLAQRWRPTLLPGHEVRTQPMVTLRPGGGLPMLLRPRV